MRPKTIALLLIVLLIVPFGILMLHLVAVGGIYAFNAMKANHPAEIANTERSEADARFTNNPAMAEGEVTVYRVNTGDTVGGIARKLHVGDEDLIRLNNIDDPKKLRIGTKLKVPTGHQATLAAAEMSH